VLLVRLPFSDFSDFSNRKALTPNLTAQTRPRKPDRANPTAQTRPPPLNPFRTSQNHGRDSLAHVGAVRVPHARVGDGEITPLGRRVVYTSAEALAAKVGWKNDDVRWPLLA